MKSLLVTLTYLALAATPLLSQRLPEGAQHANRERSYDVLHYKAQLAFDFDKQEVRGKATIRLTPLRAIQEIALDAIALNVTTVELHGNRKVAFETAPGVLTIKLPETKQPGDTLTIGITYSAQPKAGMYFVRDRSSDEAYFVTTYGEDGLHANWLPIYSDVNDRFSSEMLITVPRPYVVVSNGKLVAQDEKANGEFTYHWLQELPHPNYLIALYVGDFEKGDLEPAFGTTPLSYWVPRGKLNEGAYTFRNTTQMVEFFSTKFNYVYPWDKYDQIAVPDYAIGAMEHTGVTGHRDNVLRTESAPLDFNPTFNDYTNPWSAEALISHELAHHWFGNLVTCRNLSYIWLNESFASLLMMLWDEESLGEDQYLFSVQLARQKYFDYVHSEHIIRPLEYHYFDDSNTIFNTEHTYYKGAVVLHMLRKILGDEPFFRAMGYYLDKHAFSNVASEDLKIAIEEATGENPDWFFEQWVTGGGHPVLEVSYDYLPGRKKLILSVKQVQSLVDGQGIFELPARITIATQEETWPQHVWIESDDDVFVLDCPAEPLMVSFDGAGDLVAEIIFPKSAKQLAYQALNDAVPGRLRAIRQLASEYPTSETTTATFEKIIIGDGFWGCRAEAAHQLGTMRTSRAQALAQKALQADDYRIRKATVLALPEFGTDSAISLLQNIIDTDSHSDVVATAILALARASDDLSPAFIRTQLAKESWYDEIRVAALRACEVTEDESLVPVIKPYAKEKHNQSVRGAAIDAWAACAPADKELHRVLIALTQSPIYTLQQSALAKLGELYVSAGVERLEQVVRENADANLVTAAQQALDKIRLVGSR